MALDRERLREVFATIGNALLHPTTICLIGSSPSIFLGQAARQTQDIDIWQPMSASDEGDFAQACRAAQLIYDPQGEISPDDVYIQIVRPGIVALPRSFETEILARFGRLTLVMPPPVLIAAAKLTRASDTDLQDIVWWMRARRFGMPELESAIKSLPTRENRETAFDNLIVAALVLGDKT